MVVVRGKVRGGNLGARAGASARAGAGMPGPGDRIGVLGIDAGGTTGLAWWWGELRGNRASTFQGGTFGWCEVACGHGDPVGERAGAVTVCERWADVDGEFALAGVPVDRRYVVLEDFVLRMPVRSTARVGLASCRIGALVEGMLVRSVPGGRFVWVLPSEGAWVNSDRLRGWGLWCRGAPHSRDAARVLAVFVARML